MSNKSIESKIQGIENRFKAEMRSRGDPAFASPNGVPPSRPGIGRRPRPLGGLTSRSRQMLDLPISVPTRSLDSIETDNKLKEIYKMSGKLNINGVQYQSVIEDLEHLGELGSGTCGHVVKMLHKPSDAIIAVKQMRRSGNSEENKRILMDLDVVLRSHDCPYIVRCLGCFITDADVWICMELMSTCFDKLLKKLQLPIPEEILGQVTVATVKALSYLKDNHGVIHRDVKPSNILVDERGNVKLCDFGISGRLVDSKAKTRNAGCAAYMAPERISPPDPTKPDYDIRADVWSLGISLVELATGLFPYRNCQNDFEVLTKVIDEEPPSLPDSDSFSPEFKSFVQQCLMKNYRHRPKYGKLLEHAFLWRAARASVHVDVWIAPLLQRPTPPAVHRRVVNIPPISPVQPVIAIRNNLDDQAGRCDSANTTIDKTNVTASPTKENYDDDLDVILARNIMCNISNNKSLTLPVRKNGISFNLVSSDEDNTLKSPTNENNGDSTMDSFDGGGLIDSELESGSFSSMMNVDETNSSSRLDVTMSSAENLPSMCHKSIEGPRIPADETSSRLVLWNNVGSPSNSYTNERGQLHSNSTAPETPSPVQSRPANARCFITSDNGSPTTYYANIEVTNYPYAGGSNTPVRSSGPESGDFRDHRYIGAQVSENEEGFEARRVQAKSQGSYAGGAPRFLTGQAVSAGYHFNPGGSCSQPASLEAYGERSGFSPYPRRRTCEKSLSPPPAPPARRSLEGGAPPPMPSSRERWRTAERGTPPHGNTSPIVLQRFYHQQSQQRRSRADLSDSTRHRSLSREHSTGRSPEPPPRTGRNLSVGYEGQNSLLHDLESRVPLKHYPPDKERNSSDDTNSFRSPPPYESNLQRANVQKYDGLAHRSHSLNRCEGEKDIYTSSARERLEARLHENLERDRYEQRLHAREEDRDMCVNSVLTRERLEARLKSEIERDRFEPRLPAREEDRDTVNSVSTRERLEARLKCEGERERYEQRLHAREGDIDLNQRYEDSLRSSRFDRLHADLNRREEERDERNPKVSPQVSLHRKNGKDREDQGTNGSNGSRSSSPGRQFISNFGRGHPKQGNQHKNQRRDSELAEDIRQRLGGMQAQNGCYQDAPNGSSGRYASATPQPMPRRIVHTHATHSWSVPASPRLQQTSAVRPPPHD